MAVLIASPLGGCMWASNGMIVVLQLITLLSLLAILYQILKQQGRLLLRLDKLEANFGLGVVNRTAPAVPEGLKVGTAITISSLLLDLDGQPVSLDNFRGKRVFLVYWSPNCGYCSRIAPELALLQRDLSERQMQLVFVSLGTADANRKLAEKYGLKSPILLIKEGSEPPACFKTVGTPSAYLLDEQGRVAHSLAVGADQVPALARDAAGNPRPKRLPGERPLTESRIERDGLRAGTRAPVFTLPDVHGHPISLEEYRGRKVLLVFSDPHCGPCDELVLRLERLHREHRDNGLDVLMVSRGDADENRRKAEQHRIEFPVVLQRTWELSREYGIFATPVAFLISEDGLIAKNVAQGADAILSLAVGG